ncbi:F-box/LRR-repeat protein At5g63520 isoform X2 [Ricinus communis]|uniref:F-box/LRR-repeat protein At5g63520 isoform X2 n=1 Tax=Ricinus communis TaxID=3988 RepID=UPI000772C95D|nr:F-box/LRR-repeat protein At5g63520 isoform X2 [Ricinus communis]|eukprot:XP_015578702.1 F-box/LRR-repeat protein At5g63520 isoform X2 [Ricinus communis]
MEKNPSNSKKTVMLMRTSGFSLVSEDVIENILSRLPALSFVSASCVSKCWNKVCVRILSRPKLASALSLNPSLHEAVDEVLGKVLLQPIVPHFVIACIGKQFSLEITHQLLTKRFGTRVPVITNAASGIIGLDAATDEVREVRWESSDDEDDNNDPDSEANNLLNRGIVLVVGFVPGLKVEAIPLLRSKTVPQPTLVDKFLTDIKNFSVSVSDCTSPAGIILFGDRSIDLKPVLARMDYALNEETVMVGDASGCFLCRSVDNSHNNYGDMYLLDAVALVFSKDKHKSHDIGETQFHITLSTGLMPFGPQLQAICVIARGTDNSWLSARMEGQYDVLNGEGLLTDINDQFTDEDFPELYIGVVQQREYPIGAESTISRASMAFYEVMGGENQFFVINGVGIRPGDYFLFYHSDSGTASSSCSDAYRDLATLKSESTHKNCNNPLKEVTGSSSSSSGKEKEVFGGLIFSCYLRGEIFHPNVDSSPIHENFPGVALAGMYCNGEIGRGSSSSISQEDDEENSARCCLHYHSAVYLVLSYVPPTASEA